ncbi:MAG: hypothetical protein U1F43_24045 [Myxococcota bacterium]
MTAPLEALRAPSRASRLVLAGLALGLAAGPFAAVARADEGRHFFLFVGKDEAPSQALLESAWREADKVEAVVPVEESKRRIGQAFPRLFGQAAGAEKTAIEADLKAGKEAYFATDFELAEMHLAKALEGAYASPEVLAASASVVARLADAAGLRYANTLARKQPESAARAQLDAFVAKFPTLTPSSNDHSPEVLATWEKVREAVVKGAGDLSVSVLPLELDRSGTCRLLVNGVDVAALPMPGPLHTPIGEQFIQVRCGLQTSWLQRVTIKPGTQSMVVPVRAMVAARGEATSGGLVLVSPEEGDSAALIDAVSRATGLDGAVVARPGAPKRWDFGVWQKDTDAPVLLASGVSNGSSVTDVHVVHAASGGSRALSPWPFVVGGAGVATIIGGVVANMSYLDDRDAGKQDLDATPAAVLYGVGGALLVTGVIMLVLDLNDDDPQSAGVHAGGPTSVVVRF